MATKPFSEEEIELLKRNPYTFYVTAKKIAFTSQFKEEFKKLYEGGASARKCLKKLGYDPDMLGNGRVNSIWEGIKREIAKNGYIRPSDTTHPIPQSAVSNNPMAVIKDLEHRVRLLEAQALFKKKTNGTGEQQEKGISGQEEEKKAPKAHEIYEIIYEVVCRYPDENLIKDLCRIGNVSRSGYYAWLKAAPLRAKRIEKDARDFNLILAAVNYRGYEKGNRTIYMTLARMGHKMGRNKIRRLCRIYGYFCPIRKANPYRRMAKAMKTDLYAENLLQREFRAYGPRVVLLTDITYIRRPDGRFQYLSTILDAFTGEVLAAQVSSSLQVEFVINSLRELAAKHIIAEDAFVIIHSDQGCHYTSHAYINFLADINIVRSMSRRGNCWDNAPQESFFGHMKDEMILLDTDTDEEVADKIYDYIDYYNNDRPQWNRCKLTPSEYYEFCETGHYPLEGIFKTPPVPKATQSVKVLKERLENIQHEIDEKEKDKEQKTA